MAKKESIESMETDPPEEKKRIHFGSLEESEKQRLQLQQKAGSIISPSIMAGIKAGNINVSEGVCCKNWQFISHCI